MPLYPFYGSRYLTFFGCCPTRSCFGASSADGGGQGCRVQNPSRASHRDGVINPAAALRPLPRDVCRMPDRRRTYGVTAGAAADHRVRRLGPAVGCGDGRARARGDCRHRDHSTARSDLLGPTARHVVGVLPGGPAGGQWSARPLPAGVCDGYGTVVVGVLGRPCHRRVRPAARVRARPVCRKVCEPRQGASGCVRCNHRLGQRGGWCILA